MIYIILEYSIKKKYIYVCLCANEARLSLSLSADHNLVLTSLAIQYEITGSQSRIAFDNKLANWRDFCGFLSGIDWMYFSSLSSDDAALYFKSILERGIQRFIPQRLISPQASSHSWLNDRCIALVHQKNQTYGTDDYHEACLKCSKGLSRKRERDD